MTMARSLSTDRKYYGVAEAIVTDVNDPEEEGRVKLRYPWFDDDTVSDWARVVQLYAGNGYGTFFIPEVHGDMRMPLVLGGVYNGSDKPSTKRDDSTDEKLIRTKGGAQILIVDTEGEQRIEITDQNGNFVKMDAQEDSITIEAKGDFTLKAKKVTIEASDAVKVTGSTIDLN